MKKMIFSLSVLAALALFLSPSLKAQNSDNGWIGRARGELSDCLSGTASNWDVSASVSYYTYPCLVAPCTDGEVRVTFVGGPRCAPGTICPLYVILLAEVVFSYNGDVISSACHLRPLP